ncbi:MAG: hypothetical protein IJU90_08735 [Bacteroidales bacterium]|nr:hypothetical protein [Bacteroidales bacterium]
MKNKKIFLSIAMIAVLTTGAILFSAFTMPKQNTSANCQELKADCDGWEKIASNVAYCSGVDEDKGVCAGVNGYVWRNNSTNELCIFINCSSCTPCGSSNYYNLTYTTKHDDYNYRFYMKGQYYYIYINVPRRVVPRR